MNPKANFLFVAHREEILRQARFTFRQILKNPDFGELWFNGENPKEYNQLFVSIQTLNNRINNLPISQDFFDQSYASMPNSLKEKVAKRVKEELAQEELVKKEEAISYGREIIKKLLPDFIENIDSIDLLTSLLKTQLPLKP